MKKRIYIYEMDCYKSASEEQLQKMRIKPERYFNLEGLPSEELAEKLEEFIWERGKNHPHVKRMDVGKRVCLIK